MTTIPGKCSWFGGPDDSGVSPHEGLSLIQPGEEKLPYFSGLFLPSQPEGTTGLARRLDPSLTGLSPSKPAYCAMRFDYDQHPKQYVRGTVLLVEANGRQAWVRPVDWGPNAHTGRIIDLCPGVLAALGLKTDDAVKVTLPW